MIIITGNKGTEKVQLSDKGGGGGGERGEGDNMGGGEMRETRWGGR